MCVCALLYDVRTLILFRSANLSGPDEMKLNRCSLGEM